MSNYIHKAKPKIESETTSGWTAADFLMARQNHGVISAIIFERQGTCVI